MNKLNKEIYSLMRTLWFNLRREGLGFVIQYFPYHLKMRIMEFKEGFDLKYGTDTSDTALLKDLQTGAPHIEDASAYSPTVPTVFHDIMSYLKIPMSEYQFIDLGSGKGRALLLASHYPFQKIIGVEFCEKLHEICRNNLSKYSSKTGMKLNVDLCLVDAAEYQFPTGNNLIYLFNPFDEKILLSVIDNIQKSLIAEPNKKITIIYIHPLFDQYIKKLNLRLIAQHKDMDHVYGWKIYCNF